MVQLYRVEGWIAAYYTSITGIVIDYCILYNSCKIANVMDVVFLHIEKWFGGLNGYVSVYIRLNSLDVAFDALLSCKKKLRNPWMGHKKRSITCYQISDIIRTSIGNTIVDHCSNNIFIFDITLGSNRLRKNNCKKRRETFELWDLMRL